MTYRKLIEALSKMPEDKKDQKVSMSVGGVASWNLDGFECTVVVENGVATVMFFSDKYWE